jgi:very-short-patch-repair endonuclease
MRDEKRSCHFIGLNATLLIGLPLFHPDCHSESKRGHRLGEFAFFHSARKGASNNRLGLYNRLMDYNNRAWSSKHISLSSLREASVSTFEQCGRFAQRVNLSNHWVFSHTTALQLLRIELPYIDRHLPSTYSLDKLHVCFTHQSARSQSRDASMHWWSHDFVPVLVGGSVRCTPPTTTWAQMARYLSINELVVLGDSMMRSDARQRVARFDDFEKYLMEVRRFPGRNNCMKALPLMKEGTDSSQETRLRLLLHDHHFGNCFVNYQVLDEDTQNMYLLDLAFPDKKVGLEYDGSQHFTDAQQRRNDVLKRQRFDDLGWVIIVVHKEDLIEPDRTKLLVSNLLRALSQ